MRMIKNGFAPERQSASLSFSGLSRVKKSIRSNMLDVAYENYDDTNKIYFDEIIEEMQKTIYLKNDDDFKDYIGGFEKEYADYLEVAEASGVGSGSAALGFALRALDIGAGDEVITTAHTYIATPLAVTEVGAVPVFVDIRDDFNIDADKIEDKITQRTKAILAVHLYGKTCEMEKIIKIARKHSLYVIEDAAQAHGAQFRGKKAGTFGLLDCFSFHPSKLIGALGDGGIVVSADKKYIEKIRHLREPLYNEARVLKSGRTPSRLDPIHIPFLRTKLRHLDEIIEKRNNIAKQYNKAFFGISGLKTPDAGTESRHAFRNYTLMTEKRNQLREYLMASGIETKIFYKEPVYLRREFRVLGYRQGDFPVCDKVYAQMLSLPVSHVMTAEQADKVKKTVRRFFGENEKE